MWQCSHRTLLHLVTVIKEIRWTTGHYHHHCSTPPPLEEAHNHLAELTECLLASPTRAVPCPAWGPPGSSASQNPVAEPQCDFALRTQPTARAALPPSSNLPGYRRQPIFKCTGTVHDIDITVSAGCRRACIGAPSHTHSDGHLPAMLASQPQPHTRVAAPAARRSPARELAFASKCAATTARPTCYARPPCRTSPVCACVWREATGGRAQSSWSRCWQRTSAPWYCLARSRVTLESRIAPGQSLGSLRLLAIYRAGSECCGSAWERLRSVLGRWRPGHWRQNQQAS